MQLSEQCSMPTTERYLFFKFSSRTTLRHPGLRSRNLKCSVRVNHRHSLLADRGSSKRKPGPCNRALPAAESWHSGHNRGCRTASSWHNFTFSTPKRMQEAQLKRGCCRAAEPVHTTSDLNNSSCHTVTQAQQASVRCWSISCSSNCHLTVFCARWKQRRRACSFTF